MVYTDIRGNNTGDGRSNSKFGEMVLDTTTISGLQPGDVRFIQYGAYGWSASTPNCGQNRQCDNFNHPPTDEQPNPSMAGDYFFAGHWALGNTLKITDRSASRGSFNSPILSEPLPHFVTSISGDLGSTHYSDSAIAQSPDFRAVPYGFSIYYNQGFVYDAYWSEYAAWTVSNNTIYFRSNDGAIIALENGNP